MRLFSIIGVLFVSAFLALMTPTISCSEVVIRTDRPRLLLDSADLDRVRASLHSYGKDDFKAVKSFAIRVVADTPGKDISTKDFDPKLVASVALAGVLESNKPLMKRAIEFAVTMAKTRPDSGHVGLQWNRLISMSYVYDWLQDVLTTSDTEIIKNGIITHIIQLRGSLDNPMYTGGHSHHVSLAIMAGLISLSEKDWPSQRGALLEKLRQQWETGYLPFQAFTGDAGGHHMGWRYGAAYTNPLAYLFWEKSTGIRWGEDWRQKQIDWLIWGIRGDGTLPRFGDSWDTAPTDDNISTLIAAGSGLLKNRRAEWFQQKYLAGNWEPRRLFRLLFADPSVNPQAPWVGDPPLPLARQFGNSGFVVARDGWDTNATHLVFKSTPFYTRNHHHKDQNSFELSYRGSLLIDSGVYDAFGTPHWKNYFTRTIAHNTLVVFDPDESFFDGPDRLSNDGGQYFPAYTALPLGREPETLEEASTEKYKRDGVTGFGTTKGVTWIRGNASKAYTSSKLTSYLRDVLMINQPEGWSHPFILVLDRVHLAKPLIPSILFHSNEAPTVTRNGFSVANNQGGIVYGTVLTPSSAEVAAIGGAGKEWWVNGINYPPASKWDGKGLDAGAWRVEVSTATPKMDVEFLTLLAIGDTGEAKKFPATQALSTLDFSGAIVGKWLYLIFKGDNLRTAWRFEGAEFMQVQKIFVGGLPHGREYRFQLNGKTFSTNSTDVTVVGPNS